MYVIFDDVAVCPQNMINFLKVQFKSPPPSPSQSKTFLHSFSAHNELERISPGTQIKPVMLVVC